MFKYEDFRVPFHHVIKIYLKCSCSANYNKNGLKMFRKTGAWVLFQKQSYDKL